jgi:predicted phage terminase large subunit-like protein
LIIRDIYRERINFPFMPEKMEALAHKWNQDGKLRGIIIEDRATGTSAYQTLALTGKPEIVDNLIPFIPTGSKSTRAEQAAIHCRNGCVLLPNPSSETPWLFDYEEELYTAPSGVFMDQVDATSQIILYLEHYLAAGLRFREGEATL